MAERLTEIGMFIDTPVYKIKNGKKSEAVDKLAHLEDIMEKYGIESVEELDEKLANFDNFMKGNKFETIEDLQNALNGKFIEVFDEKNKIWQEMVKNLTKTEQDRDTWKRACELACDVLRDINYYVKDRIDFENSFYQQAKKEKEGESK